jgi:hypothetical protein
MVLESSQKGEMDYLVGDKRSMRFIEDVQKNATPEEFLPSSQTFKRSRLN